MSCSRLDEQALKPFLCYPCALRMTTLFCVPAPPPRSHVFSSIKLEDRDPMLPIVQRDLNTKYWIVYETERSPDRVLPARGAPLVSTECVFDLAEHVRLGRKDDTAAAKSCICAACCGLYQFMDAIIVPLIAAQVRVSPYLESSVVSTNVNCPRGMTFVWLAAAVVFARGGYCSGVANEGPSASAIIPEEFASFKDFYMGDMRARILSYLTQPHEVIISSQLSEVRTESAKALYHSTVEATVRWREELAAALGSSQKPTSGKRAREEAGECLFDGTAVPRVCAQSFTFAASGDGVQVDVDAVAPAPYELLALPDKVVEQMNKTMTKNSQWRPREEDRLVSVVPAQYCSNKGSVMNYGVIYDYVLPHLEERSLGCFRVEDPAAVDCKEPLLANIVASVTHANVFLIGSYRKMLRSLSQSPWFCDGGRIGSYSLQEVIAQPFLHAVFPFGIPTGVLPNNVAKRQTRTAVYVASLDEKETQQWEEHHQRKSRSRGPDNNLVASAVPSPQPDTFDVALKEVVGYGRYKFHSAGREDVDVRMLGTGRPFVLEIVSPHRASLDPATLKRLEDAVNESEGGCVEISGMRYTTTDITVDLARHSESKTKTYRCVVWCSRRISSDDDPLLLAANRTVDLQIAQKTPLRVLHRRSLLDRPRTIHSIRCERVNDHWLVVDLETQAGTYVKEFIHGDMGRTVPNLGMLLNGRTDIIQLDVLGMVMQDLQ